LNPATAITWRKRSRPQDELFVRPRAELGTSRTMLHTSFVSEEIIARELEVVLRAFHVAEEGSLRQPAKKAGIACLCNPRLAPY